VIGVGTGFSIGSFSIAGSEPFAGMVRDDYVIALAAFEEDGLGGSVLDLLERWDLTLPRLVRSAERWSVDQDGLAALAVRVDRLRVRPPFRPRQIFAMSANYRKHVIELVMGDPDMRSDELASAPDDAARYAAAERIMDERADDAQPYALNKLPSALAGPFDPLPIPADMQKIDWECELAVVIGRGARHVAAADAWSHVAGFAIANDVTARDLVFRRDIKAMGTDWVSSKSQPGFLPLGPYLVPAAFVNHRDLRIRLSVNDRVMQDESTRDMLIPIDRQIEYLSSRVQLLPGDVICTGSPAGNGSHHGVFLRSGDVMRASISGLGEQRTPCV